jgi:hypothetical protein
MLLGLSIPGYLLMDSSDFEIAKPLTKGGGGEILLATPVSPNLKQYGKYIVVKKIAGTLV